MWGLGFSLQCWKKNWDTVHSMHRVRFDFDSLPHPRIHNSGQFAFSYVPQFVGSIFKFPVKDDASLWCSFCSSQINISSSLSLRPPTWVSYYQQGHWNLRVTVFMSTGLPAYICCINCRFSVHFSHLRIYLSFIFYWVFAWFLVGKPSAILLDVLNCFAYVARNLPKSLE